MALPQPKWTQQRNGERSWSGWEQDHAIGNRKINCAYFYNAYKKVLPEQQRKVIENGVLYIRCVLLAGQVCLCAHYTTNSALSSYFIFFFVRLCSVFGRCMLIFVRYEFTGRAFVRLREMRCWNIYTERNEYCYFFSFLLLFSLMLMQSHSYRTYSGKNTRRYWILFTLLRAKYQRELEYNGNIADDWNNQTNRFMFYMNRFALIMIHILCIHSHPPTNKRVSK